MAPKFYVETYRVRPTRKVLGVDFPVRGPAQYAWRAKAMNHEILCSGESYQREADMIDTITSLFGYGVELRERAS